jgi:hypothetical protein
MNNFTQTILKYLAIIALIYISLKFIVPLIIELIGIILVFIIKLIMWIAIIILFFLLGNFIYQAYKNNS